MMAKDKPILKWDKPERVMSKEEHQSISADGAPPGVYIPNMSQEDMQTFKAKLVGVRKGPKQVEIRVTRGSQILIIVSNEDPSLAKERKYAEEWRASREKLGARVVAPDDDEEKSNIRISMNGPAWFTYQDWEDLNQAIQEAREALR